MINCETGIFQYYLYGEKNAYGQPALSKNPRGTIKIAIYETSQNVQDNVNYTGASYIGLTQDRSINDKMVFAYKGLMLKVKYVQPRGRFLQAFMEKM